MSEADRIASEHQDEMTLLLYVERQLDRDAARVVSLHTQSCGRCLALLRALDHESRLLTRSLIEADEALPARLAEFHAKAARSFEWFWAVVFGLGVLGGYALYSGYIEPWEQQFERAGFTGTSLLSLLLFQGAFWKGWQSMFTLVEFIALVSLGGFAVLALRKFARRGTARVALLLGIGLWFVIATPVPAQELKIDMKDKASLEVKKDEVLNKDLFFSGQHLRVNGTVDGDIYAFGQQVDINGHVTGDVICFAESARISGQVDGNVRSFTNNVTISGSVAKSVTALNETLNLDSQGEIGHNLTVMGQTAAIDGKVGRDVLAMGQTTSVSGTIDGNLRAKGRSLTFASSARIKGQTKFEGEIPAEVSPDAKLASPIEFKKLEHRSHLARGTRYYVWKLIWAAAGILFGLVLISLMPAFARETVESAESYGASIGLGVLVFFGAFLAACIACVTIVGLFVGISSLFLYLVMLFSSSLVVGAVIGRWIFGKDPELWPMVGRMAVGVVLIKLVASVPHLGFWVTLAVWIWGMGAISLALYRRLQPVVAPRIPSVPTGPAPGIPLPPNTTVGGL